MTRLQRTGAAVPVRGCLAVLLVAAGSILTATPAGARIDTTMPHYACKSAQGYLIANVYVERAVSAAGVSYWLTPESDAGPSQYAAALSPGGTVLVTGTGRLRLTAKQAVRNPSVRVVLRYSPGGRATECRTGTFRLS